MKTYILIVFLLLRVLSFGQWTPVSMGVNTNFFDVQFVNESVGFVSGNLGTFLKTTDNGLTWININNTGDLHTFKFHFPSETVGYALGNNSLFKTVDQGTTWTSLPNINTFDKKNIFFINETTGFFLAAYGVIFKTTDGGISWINIQTNCDSTIVEEDIHFADQNTGYFGGWYGNCASKTIDGGATWQVLPNSLLYQIYSIYFPTPTIGYMAGYSSGQMKGIQKTEDGGTTWVAQNTPTSTYTSIFCIDTNICFAVGPNGVIIKTTDGGSNWLQQDSGTSNNLRKIHCTDVNSCYAVGDSGTLLKTGNGGLGINQIDINKTKTKLSPNPAKSEIQIQSSSDISQLEIYDELGRKIELVISSTKKVNIETLASGSYFLKIYSSNSENEIVKFLKE